MRKLTHLLGFPGRASIAKRELARAEGVSKRGRAQRGETAGMKYITRRFRRAQEGDAATVLPAVADMTTPQVIVRDEKKPGTIDSGVYKAAAPARGLDPAQGWVTLVVYGWENVQPGTLSWIFPSFASALSAVRALRNAVKWAILVGQRRATHVDVEAERASGHVLLEAS